MNMTIPTPTEERVISMIEALPPCDIRPDGMPTAEAFIRMKNSLTPAEKQEMAEHTLFRAGEMYMELQVVIGAAERLGDGRYRVWRDLTAEEDEAIGVLMESALNETERNYPELQKRDNISVIDDGV
jgi:hypothetical protein